VPCPAGTAPMGGERSGIVGRTTSLIWGWLLCALLASGGAARHPLGVWRHRAGLPVHGAVAAVGHPATASRPLQATAAVLPAFGAAAAWSQPATAAHLDKEDGSSGGEVSEGLERGPDLAELKNARPARMCTMYLPASDLRLTAIPEKLGARWTHLRTPATAQLVRYGVSLVSANAASTGVRFPWGGGELDCARAVAGWGRPVWRRGATSGGAAGRVWQAAAARLTSATAAALPLEASWAGGARAAPGTAGPGATPLPGGGDAASSEGGFFGYSATSSSLLSGAQAASQ
jgi:hypothetical protein